MSSAGLHRGLGRVWHMAGALAIVAVLVLVAAAPQVAGAGLNAAEAAQVGDSHAAGAGSAHSHLFQGAITSNSLNQAPLAGVFGTALQFNGANAVTFPSSMDNAELTAMAWFYYTGGASINTILGNKAGGCSPGLRGWAVYVNTWGTSNRVLMLEWGHSSVGCDGLGTGPGAVALNSWQHVAVTLNATTGLVKLYLNGAEVGREASPRRSLATRGLAIGQFAANDASYRFHGKIDEVRIWHRELSAAEILAQMYARPAGNEPGLVGYWTFDENQGNTLYDHAIGDGAQNGLLVGSPAWSLANIPLITSREIPVRVEAVGQDSDGDPLMVVWASDPPHGTVTVASDGASFTYTPDYNYVGADSFQYTVSDGMATDSATVSVTVSGNARPTVAVNAGLTVPKGQSATISGDRLRATDPDNTAGELTYTLLAPPVHGTLFLAGAALTTGDRWTQQDIDDGKLSYTQNGSEMAGDGFVFRVGDNAGNSTPDATFAITLLRPTLVAHKTDGLERWYAGWNYRYTIVVTNTGPVAAENLIVTDTLPAGVMATSLPTGAVRGEGGAIRWSPGLLGAGQALTLTLPVRTFSNVRGTVINAVVATCEGDVLASASDVTVIMAPPTVVPTATVTPTATSTPTPRPSATATATPSATVTATSTFTPRPSAMATVTPSATVTATPTATATPMPLRGISLPVILR